jgi:heme A synthase
VLENRLYLSAVGVSILLALALQAVRSKYARWDRALLVAATVVLLALGATTVRYSRSFQDRQRFAQAAILASPNSALAVNLLRRNALSAARRTPSGPSPTGGVTPGRPGPNPR